MRVFEMVESNVWPVAVLVAASGDVCVIAHFAARRGAPLVAEHGVARVLDVPRVFGVFAFGKAVHRRKSVGVLAVARGNEHVAVTFADAQAPVAPARSFLFVAVVVRVLDVVEVDCGSGLGHYTPARHPRPLALFSM